ncbi:MAG: oligoendopeptidase F [Melioribacteraceae bacterium]|nr:MAG: oligoendopeptidase F [Melioribacteraceae bacterium]
MPPLKLLKYFSIFLILCGTLMAQDATMTRDNIEDKYKWDLSDIYQNWDEWEAGLENLGKKMDEIAALKGTINSGDNLLKIFLLQDDMNQLAYKVYRYPQLMRDTDTRNQEVAGKMQRVMIMFSRFSTATSWISPEVLETPWETMEKWLANTDGIEPYRFQVEDLYRQQKHVLDEEKEKLLSYFSSFNGTPSQVYTELSTSDIDFPEIELSNGETFKVTSGNYSKTLATNRNQEDRKKAFEAHYGVYNDSKNTYAQIYNAVCQRDWAQAQARNYNSTLEAALDGNNIPVEVYENLIKTVKENTDPLKKYVKLRKEVLGLEEYHSYDGSINLIDFDKTYEYDDAMGMVMESIKPLGDEYTSKYEKALNDGWIDVMENEGKRPGAYSANVYGVHPYMLLNYNGTLDYVFTLGHEMGHTMHTLLANENQPFATASYTIFVAEVASTFNEALLLDHLLEKTDDPKERIALLTQSIRNITGTFFFQTLLADYELQVHKLVEQGSPVTADVLDNIMRDLFSAYYGDAQISDELLNTVWARIGHFYRSPYYVFQYATCFASSAKLYNDFEAASTDGQKEEFLNRYLGLLKSGGNDYPMEQLRRAGVDLTQPEPVMAVIKQLDELVNQLEVELKKVKS